jgi:transcriptional regulator of acetoin/glycerol metabolism
MELQAKLLRFLQERVIERLGGRKEIPVDVRVICATHQNLEQHIAEGKFREDLYYRVSEMVIDIPSAQGARRRRGRAGQGLPVALCRRQGHGREGLRQRRPARHRATTPGRATCANSSPG